MQRSELVSHWDSRRERDSERRGNSAVVSSRVYRESAWREAATGMAWGTVGVARLAAARQAVGCIAQIVRNSQCIGSWQRAEVVAIVVVAPGVASRGSVAETGAALASSATALA